MNEFGYLPMISILPSEEGGGFLIEFPDLPGCVSDGDTIDEAIANGRDAIICWIETARQHGDEIPQPKPCVLTPELIEKGIIRTETPSNIDPNQIIHQNQPFSTPQQTWEFDWSVNPSISI